MIKSNKGRAFGTQLLLSLVSSAFLILSFPDFNLEFLAWIALVPLLFAIKEAGPVRSFLLSFLAGFVFFLGTIYWLIHVTLPGAVIVALYLALYFGFFGLFSASALRNPSIVTLFFIPAAWAVSEYLRAHLLGGFGWVLLGHSQSRALPVIQIADITGAYGVGAVIALVNAAVFFTLSGLREGIYRYRYIAAALVVLYATLAYGVFRVKNVFAGEGLRVSVIQGNIPQDRKWDAGFRNWILNRYDGLTRNAAAFGTDLIVWPEASVPGFMEAEPDLYERVKSLAMGVKTPLLVGTPYRSFAKEPRLHNSAVLFADDGRIVDRYDKLHLVPFGEYIPAKPVFSFAERFAPLPIGDFSPGAKPTVFKIIIKRELRDDTASWRMLKNIKFSCLICFEDVFPGISRRFVREGAAFLVNITNDAWFKKTAAPYQHAQSSVFRAVENRVNVIRAANTGLSCFIDQKGRVIGAVTDGSREIFVEGYATKEIFLTRTRTFYTVYGDIFAYVCMAFLAIFSIYHSSRIRSGRR